MKQEFPIGWAEAAIVVFGALGLLFLLSMFPLDPIIFAYQEI